MLSFWKDYVSKHPETVILDPLENVRQLLDRYRQYKLIDESELAREGDPLSLDFFYSLLTIIRIAYRRSLYSNFCRIDDNWCQPKSTETEWRER